MVVGLAGSALALRPASAQLLPFTHYTPESDLRALPSAEVHSVAQDGLGYLWAAVYSSGLVRYDGVRMEVYNRDDGLRDLAVWETVEDADGHLWVASNGGLVVSERPLGAYAPGQRVRFTEAPGGVPLLDVGVQYNRVAVDRQGRIWVGTGGLGIVRYTWGRAGLRADTLAVDTGSGPVSVQALLARRDGSVWAGLGDGRIVSFESGALRTVAETESGGRSPSVLYETKSGAVWGGSRDGSVWRIRDRGGFFSISDPLGGVATAILEAQDGTFFVATAGSGLLTVNASGQRVLTRKNGLLSLSVHDVFQDAEGSIWVAQSGGLSKLRPGYRALTSYTSQSTSGELPALPAAAVGAVTPGDSACAIWAGTPEGVACLSGSTTVQTSHLGVAEGLSAANVNALVRDERGRVWIGTLSGIDVLTAPGERVPAGRFLRRVVLNGRPFDLSALGGSSILGASPLRLGGRETVWFAAFRRLYGLVGETWVQLGASAGLPETVFHAVAADPAGHLWVGTRDRGVYRSRSPLTPGALNRWAASPAAPITATDTTDLFVPVWTTEEGAPTDQIETLLWAGDAMWVGTQSGLFVLTPTRGGVRQVASLSEAQGLASSSVFSLAQAPDGAVWAGTNGGLAEIDPDTRRVRRTLQRRDGLVGNEVWYHGSVQTDPQGRVYFGTAQGLSVYDPTLAASARAAPRLRFRQTNVMRLPSGYTEATFLVAGLSFVDETAVRYRYRLLGYEDVWSPPTNDPSRRYTRLASVLVPRRYTLEVIAGTVGGTWTSDPIRYSFRVPPPWWLGPWVFLGSLVALGAALYGGSRVHRRRVVKRELEQARIREAELRARRADAEREATEARAQVLRAEAGRQALELEKARELADAFEALERSHQELKEAQAQLVQQEKMASLGRVTSGVAHELKNPLNFITNFSRLSVELSDEITSLVARRADGELGADELQGLVNDLRENALRIEGHGRRADEIVRTMLLLSAGSGGPRQLVKINAVVGDSVGLAEQGKRTACPDIEVEVDLDLEPGAGYVEVAPLDLGRVFINLFDNAFDAVCERAAQEEPGYVPTIRITTASHDGRVRVTVADNGPGVPAKIRANVFDPFFTTKPTGSGTGLGLSLSFDVVAQHGGTLTLHDAPGGGAAFVVSLPSAEGPPADEPNTAGVEADVEAEGVMDDAHPS